MQLSVTGSGLHPSGNAVVFSVTFSLLLLVGALIVGKMRPPPLPKMGALARAAGLGLASFALVALLAFVEHRLGAAGPRGAPLNLPMAMAIVLAAPVGEEFVFRHFVHSRLQPVTGRTTNALTSALLFVLAHSFVLGVGLTAGVVPLVSPALLSIVASYCYFALGGVWAAIAVHMAFNAAWVVSQFLAGHSA